MKPSVTGLPRRGSNFPKVGLSSPLFAAFAEVSVGPG